MPALFSLGQHEALVAARSHLQPGELLVAFLDDIYLVTTPARASAAFDVVRQALRDHAGIEADLGKCRVWNRQGGPAPPGVEALGPEVWRGDEPLHERGLKVLGAPLGSDEYITALGQQRLREEQVLTDLLPKLPDLQSAWLLLLMCAAPRANHLLRTLPPCAAKYYAETHDEQQLESLAALVRRDGFTGQNHRRTRCLAQLPLRMGGLALRSASRTSEPAYWAAWADALPVLRRRCPEQAQCILSQLAAPGTEQAACLKAANEAAAALDQEGFAERPSWQAAFDGARPEPPQQADREPGEWQHGWQYYASSSREHHFKRTVVEPSLSPTCQALLRSQAGPQAGRAFTAVPTCRETTLRNEHMQVLLRRRLRLRMALGTQRCPARRCLSHRLDAYGDHLSACPRSGLLRRRAGLTETALRRVLREAGARVVPNMRLRDAGVPGVRDDREVEAVAFGLPLRGGVPIFVDITLVSPVRANGLPAHRADTVNGAAAAEAEHRKQVKYPELVASADAHLEVVALETGGRWSQASAAFVSELAWARAGAAPALLRAAAAHARIARWTAILAVAAQGALAASLLGHEPGLAAGRDGEGPLLSDLLTGPAPLGGLPAWSRLPAN